VENNNFYSNRFKEIADEIENMRMEIYSSLHIDIDNADDKTELDDMLFQIQSKLRYDVKEIIECYEN
jgi:hypothetical protein